MQTPIEELTDWLKRNAAHFTAEHYTPDQIAAVAIAAGMDRQAVAQWETHVRFEAIQ